MYGNPRTVPDTPSLALSIQIEDATTYPGDKGEEPRHLEVIPKSLLMAVCFMEGFPVVERWLCGQKSACHQA